MKLRLVTITHCFPARGGGIELVAAALIDEFVRRGVEIEWFSSATAPQPESSVRCRSVAVPACNLVEKWTQLPFPLWSPRVIPELWTAIGRADVVHVHEHIYVGSLIATAIARMRGRPVVITQHVGALSFKSRFLSMLYRRIAILVGKLMFPAAAHVVFISANVRSFFSQQENACAHLIYNGLDGERFAPTTTVERHSLRARLGLSPQRPAILFVGRFVRKKGLDIIHVLARRFTDVDWLLVGSGPENPATWNNPNVRVVGRLANRELPAYYRACDLLILPSSGEGFPLVIQEALACGLGVLSTEENADACPPARPLIRSVPLSERSVDQWQAALRALLADAEYLDARAFRSASAHALWSWRRCASEYIELFGAADAPG